MSSSALQFCKSKIIKLDIETSVEKIAITRKESNLESESVLKMCSHSSLNDEQHIEQKESANKGPPKMKDKIIWQLVAPNSTLPFAISQSNDEIEAWMRIYPNSGNENSKNLLPLMNFLKSMNMINLKKTMLMDAAVGTVDNVKIDTDVVPINAKNKCAEDENFKTVTVVKAAKSKAFEFAVKNNDTINRTAEITTQGCIEVQESTNMNLNCIKKKHSPQTSLSKFSAIQESIEEGGEHVHTNNKSETNNFSVNVEEGKEHNPNSKKSETKAISGNCNKLPHLKPVEEKEPELEIQQKNKIKSTGVDNSGNKLNYGSTNLSDGNKHLTGYANIIKHKYGEEVSTTKENKPTLPKADSKGDFEEKPHCDLQTNSSSEIITDAEDQLKRNVGREIHKIDSKNKLKQISPTNLAEEKKELIQKKNPWNLTTSTQQIDVSSKQRCSSIRRKDLASSRSMTVSSVVSTKGVKPRIKLEYKQGSPDPAVSRTGLFPVMCSIRPTVPRVSYKMRRQQSINENC